MSEIDATRISGVSKWINGTPLIAVTSRYKSFDGLWFTTLYEIAHILLHPPKRSTYIDFKSKARDNDDSQETAANTFAEQHLVPPAYRDKLLAAQTVGSITSLASTLGVSPSIVAGQWAFLTNDWGGPIGKLRTRTRVDLADVLTPRSAHFSPQ